MRIVVNLNPSAVLAIMEKRGMNQTDLARAMGGATSQSNVSAWVNRSNKAYSGRVTTETLVTMAKALGVEPAAIKSRTNIAPLYKKAAKKFIPTALPPGSRVVEIKRHKYAGVWRPGYTRVVSKEGLKNISEAAKKRHERERLAAQGQDQSPTAFTPARKSIGTGGQANGSIEKYAGTASKVLVVGGGQYQILNLTDVELFFVS